MAEGDVEDVSPAKIQVKSSGTVLPYVGVACLGAILFGYHLGYALLMSNFSCLADIKWQQQLSRFLNLLISDWLLSNMFFSWMV